MPDALGYEEDGAKEPYLLLMPNPLSYIHATEALVELTSENIDYYPSALDYKDISIIGYSEGGRNTIITASLSEFLNEFNIYGKLASGAPPIDLNYIQKRIAEDTQVGLDLFLKYYIALDTYYDMDAEITDFLNVDPDSGKYTGYNEKFIEALNKEYEDKEKVYADMYTISDMQDASESYSKVPYAKFYYSQNDELIEPGTISGFISRYSAYNVNDVSFDAFCGNSDHITCAGYFINNEFLK